MNQPYAYICPLLTHPPTSKSSQSTELSSLSYTAAAHWLSLLHMLVYTEVKVKMLSPVPLVVTPWTVAHQAPLSMEFSRQECWSGLSFPSQRGLSNPGMEPGSLALQADSLPSEPPGKLICIKCTVYPGSLIWGLDFDIKLWQFINFRDWLAGWLRGDILILC